jgi:hypothetical protein
LIQCFLLENEDPNTFVEILVVGLREILQIAIKDRTIMLRVPSGNMRATAKFSEGVVLYYEEEQE